MKFRVYMVLVFVLLSFKGWTQESVPESNPSSRITHRFWWELYNESMSTERIDENIVSFSHIRIGGRIQGLPGMTGEWYLLGRYGKDLHKDFWNNRAEFGLGLRMRFLSRVFLALYGEWIEGGYIHVPEENAQAAEDRYHDLRGGLIFWYGWTPQDEGSGWASFVPKTFGDIYSDISYFRSQDHNVIGYAHVKTGWNLLRIWKTGLDVYGVFYIMKDVNRDFWNNKLEWGPGIWIRPWSGLDLKIFAERLAGRYFGIEAEDPNPFPQQYTDWRVGVLFWIGM